ncbi:MAG TPA: family 43 glycosylhydrolase [Candidatus Elarobacter sp.]
MVSLPNPLHAAFNGKYRNPVHAGDFPDPSVIRTGSGPARAFYAVTTSTDWAPFFPIFKSTDLIGWELVGHVFVRRPDWCAGNFWAPDFAEKDGRFYVYYTARRKDGPLCVAVATADRPEGPYVDHGPLIGQSYGSIDAMAADDGDGTRWLLWKEDGNAHNKPTPIWAQRLSGDGLVLLGEKIELLRNDAPWEGKLVEAPHVIRRNGWFYMFYSGNACCGEECAYAVGVARARSLAGPWEKSPRNPILAGNEAFRCPGHGAPVDDGKGNWYYLYHAYEERADAIYVGRQLCLDAIRWSPDGWPSINGGNGPSRVAEAPFPSLERQAPQRARWSADFGIPLDRGWQWPQSGTPSMELDHGALVLKALHPRRGADPLAGVAARTVSTGDYAATAVVDAREQSPGTLASLCAYGSHRDALGIGVRDGVVTVWRRRGGHLVELALAPAGREKLHLRCTALDGHAYRFSFSRDGGRQWITLGGRIDGAWLPPWDAGVRIALAVGGTNGASARFSALRFEPTPAPVTRIDLRPSRRERIAEVLAKVAPARLATARRL